VEHPFVDAPMKIVVVSWKSSGDKAFQRKDLDIKVKCRFCFKAEAVGFWSCPCDLRWHSCETRRYLCKHVGQVQAPADIADVQRRPSQSSRARERNAGETAPDYETLVADDLKRARKRNDVGSN